MIGMGEEKNVKKVAEKAREDMTEGVKESVEAVKAFGRGVKKEVDKHKDE